MDYAYNWDFYGRTKQKFPPKGIYSLFLIRQQAEEI
jgi:hypothetical protein